MTGFFTLQFDNGLNATLPPAVTQEKNKTNRANCFDNKKETKVTVYIAVFLIPYKGVSHINIQKKVTENACGLKHCFITLQI